MLNAAESTTTAAVAGSGNGTGGKQATVDADLFAKELGAYLSQTGASSATGEAMSRAMEKLAGAFPGATITTRAMSSFSETSQYFSTVFDETSININPEMMQHIAEDEETFTRVKSLLEQVLSAGKAQNLVNAGGSSVQRSVNISSMEVRYVEVQRNGGGTQLSVSSLALETQKMVADTLEKLLGANQSTQSGNTRSGGIFSSLSASGSSWDFGSLVGSSSSWRFESIVSSSSLNQLVRAQQSTVMTMDVIIEQWEASGTEADLFTYMQVMGLCDPLVFDLGDEGINLGSVDEGVYFDIKGDGSPVQTAWIKGNNAFLYLDENGNGVADDVNELFGDQAGFANGFEKLAQYDDNGDGVIDENDAIYRQLRLWRDLNGDGVNQASESMTLAEAGIKAINLRHDNNKNLDAHGNVVGERSTFTRADGSQGLVADVWLRNR